VGAHQDFIVISLKPGKTLPDGFADKANTHWSMGSVQLLAWAVNSSNNDLTDPSNKSAKFVLCGTPVSSVAHQTAADLIDRGQLAGLVGNFAIATQIGPVAISLLNDPFGLQPLFWYKGKSCSICGTRADLVGIAAEKIDGLELQLNLDCIRQMTILGQAEGQKTAICQVDIVPYGHEVFFNNSGMTSARYWPAIWRQDMKDKTKGLKELHDIVDAKIQMFRNLVKRSNSPIEIDLTGGKDTRTILAICKAAGILKDVVFVTQGAESFPDVIIASHIAKTMDLNFVNTDWLPPLYEWETEIKLRSLESFGRRGGAEPALPRPGKTWRVQGIFGENWRTYYPGRPEPNSPDDVLSFHSRKFTWRAPFFKSKPFNAYVDDSLAFQKSRMDEGVTLEDATDVDFIYQYARTAYAGRIRYFDRNLLPLADHRAQGLAFAMGLDVRREGWAIEETLKYCGLNLSLPYTKQIVDSSEMELRVVPGYKAHGARKLQSERDYWAHLESAPHKDMANHDRQPIYKSILLDDPGYKIYNWVNYESIEQVLSKPIGMNLRLFRFISDLVAGKLWMSNFLNLLEYRRHYFG